jgi:GDPmannose 4,6-dehydratase
MKKALVTGITGLDAFHLVELLLAKGYEVHGIKSHNLQLEINRAGTAYCLYFVNHSCFHLHSADLVNVEELSSLIENVRPDELYHLGTSSYINDSSKTLQYANEINALCTLRLLEAIYVSGLTHSIRVYQSAPPVLGNHFDKTVISRFSAKPSSYHIMDFYRTSRGMYACNGILFGRNLCYYGEPPLINKIIRGVVRIALGLQGMLYLNSFNSRLDWGYGQDYAECMWRILQQSKPENFVIATGVITTVREFVRLVFAELGIEIVFQGEDAREVGYVVACHDTDFVLMPGQTVTAIDTTRYRNQIIEPPLAEVSKVRRQLGWKPRYDLCALIQEMVQHDLQLVQHDIKSLLDDHLVLL